MKKISVLAVSAIVVVGGVFTSCDSNKSISNVKLASDVDSVSYMMGKASAYSTPKQMENWPVKGNLDAFYAGLNDGMNNPKDSLFLGKDMVAVNEYITGFYMKLQQIYLDKNMEEGVAFLAENKTKSGVMTTESGLQYKVITEGTGAKPNAESVVKVHYVGTYTDGTEFDSSIGRGEPSEFIVGGVIAGWTEGLQLMNVGSKYMFWIPTELAYAATRQDVKPNSALIFEVELLEIVK